MRPWTLGCGCLAALLLTASTALADTINVPADHDTIQAAVDAAGPGDVIVIRKGRYEEKVLLDGKSDLTLRAKGKVVIAGGPRIPGSGIEVRQGSNILIQGLRIESWASAGVLIDGSTHVTVTRCALRSFGKWAVRAVASDFVEISRCTIDGTLDDGISFGVGEPDGGVDDSIVTRCRLKGCRADAIDVSGDRNEISRNVIQSAEEDGIEIDRDDRGAFNVISRNKVGPVPGDGIYVGGDDCEISDNQVKRNESDAIVIDGTRNAVLRNKCIAPGADGVYLLVAGNSVEDNDVVKPGDDGYDTDAGGQTFTRNRATKAGSNGFEIGGSDSTLTDNSAKHSGGFDLLHGGDNTLGVNAFKTIQIE